MKRILLVSVLIAGIAPDVHGQVAASSATRPHVEALASEQMAGREAGSEGERLAAEYLAAELTRMGARPLPGRSEMFAAFEFTAGSRDGGSRIRLTREAGVHVFEAPAEVQALSFSDDAVVTAPAVFAGYGLVVPESQAFGYDSYAGLDVTGKVVVVLRYFPEDAEPATRSILARYSDLRYKAMAARQRGASALVVVTGPRSPNAGETVPMRFDTALAGSGLPAASVSGAVATALFQGAGTLRDIQEELDSGNPHVTGFDLPGIEVTLETSVVRETRTARNVLAYLPATTLDDRLDKPWVVVGAHYDHLGDGAHGGSLAAPGEAGRPHFGADDNASGTAAALAIAESLAARPRHRHLLVALWSAEEIGLVGSNAFVAAPPVPLAQIAAYLNFDMVGRMQDNRLAAQATGTSPVWPSLLERVNVAAGFDLALQPNPYQPTDVATFSLADVPSLSFTTGAHEDYHKPSDSPEKINYDDLDRIADMAARIVMHLMETQEPPLFTRVEQTEQPGSRAGLRVFTGTIPDYVSTAEGLLLGGVIAGGPAEEAGLQKGDLIVEIAGHSIANIYDYTYALDLLSIGEPARVVYVRNGERRETTLTPAARR